MGQPIIRYEAGQTVYPFAEMTGDGQTYQAGFAPVSAAPGFEPVIAPYGLLTGGVITPHNDNDKVTVSALTALMAGVSGADATGMIVVASGALSITRGVGTDICCITSITVDLSGALAAVAGTDGEAFTETRGAAGGPPLIPVGSIEIGQVRTSSVVSAKVLASEIYQVPGLHQERSDQPVWQLDHATGKVTFADALPPIHTGAIPKKVFLRGAAPSFAPIPRTSAWVPAEATYSINSTDTYDGPIGSAQSSLAQASFTAILQDGVSDALVGLKGRRLWFEFRPDRDKSLPKQLTQGIFGITRTFPAGGGSISAQCTITPEAASVDVTI